jgi:hypothetical protein
MPGRVGLPARSPRRSPTISPRLVTARTRLLANISRKRHLGLLTAATGVGAAFVVMIGTGYRVTHSAGSPIGDVAYLTAIVVLVLLVVVAVRSYWPGRASASDAPPFTATEGLPVPDASEPADHATGQFAELRRRIDTLAALIDAPANLIPTERVSVGNGLPHLEIDGETYHYVHEERGKEFDRFSTTSLDDLLYRVLRDVAFSMSSNLARPHRKPGEDFRREMFRQQLMLLRRLNPEWETRCSAEHREVLMKHPFVDEAERQ